MGFFNRNKFKAEKVIPLSRYGVTHILMSAISMPAASIAAFEEIATKGLSLLSLGFVATAVTMGVRFAKSLDNYVVGKYALDKGGRFSNLIYRTFRKSPLRIYTVNHLGRHVEQLLTSADERAAFRSEYRTPKEKAVETISTNTQPLLVDAQKETNDYTIKRTADYLARVSDPRRHIEHVMAATLAVFAGVKLLGELSGHGHLSLLKIAERVGGYALDLAYSVGHIDAYIQRRAAENPPRPFFVLANKWAKKSPITRLGGNLYLRWDYRNIRALESGGQTWQWRAEMAVAKALPSFIGKYYVAFLDRRKMKITPEVIDRLKDINAIERLDNLKSVAVGQQQAGDVGNIRIRSAYAQLVADTDVMAMKIGEQYRTYAAQVAKRNEVNAERFYASPSQVTTTTSSTADSLPSAQNPSRPSSSPKSAFPDRGNG